MRSLTEVIYIYSCIYLEKIYTGSTEEKNVSPSVSIIFVELDCSQIYNELWRLNTSLGFRLSNHL